MPGLNNFVSSTGGFLLGIDEADPTLYIKASAKDPRIATADYPVGSLVLYVNGNSTSLLQKRGTGTNDWVTVSQDTGALNAETVTSGALVLGAATSFLSVTGTQAYTLGDGEFVGQKKTVEVSVAASTPAGTLTLNDAFGTESLVHYFDTVGQRLELEWTATGWKTVSKRRAGVEIVVIGTTVLTGHDMHAVLSCSVTGTVSSTGTRAVPDGTVPGEILIVACSTAAATPIGNINFTGLTLANVAATDLQAIGATTDTVTLEWTGVKWLVIANSGITVA